MANAQQDILTVSQLTRRVKQTLEARVGRVWVAGEISNWRVVSSGHAYFTLKDENSQIDAVMFRSKLARLKFVPDSGLEVLAHGQVTVYERRGNYQIVCEDMHPKGLGALQLAYEKLKQKLDAEGLFDEALKKPLPLLPKRIGVVTSPTGAAIRDMLHVINRRFADVHVLLYPARVQGEEAAAEIAEGIHVLDQYGVDVIIVGRGGGSLEDLWPFNEEMLVRAVHAAQTPIISAVGHEIDFVLSDFAADVRAPTPSAAAELVVQERATLVERLGNLRQRLGRTMTHAVEQARARVVMAQNSFVFQRHEALFQEQRLNLDGLRARLEDGVEVSTRQMTDRVQRAARALALLSPSRQLRSAQDRLMTSRNRLLHCGGRITERSRARLHPLLAGLDALSPLRILSRGYALVRKQPDNAIVRDARQLATDDEVTILFGTGSATATVQSIEEEHHG